jgi:hypothetical protein
VATWTRGARSGAQRITLSRKLPTGKTLKRGRYKLSLAVGAGATASAAAIRVR